MLVNLEMQNYRMAESLSLRSQGYASRMVSDQIEVGGSFDFIPVLQIMITKRMPEMKAKMCIRDRYFESEIEVVEENNEFLRVRHKATQRLLEIPRSALRMKMCIRDSGAPLEYASPFS